MIYRSANKLVMTSNFKACSSQSSTISDTPRSISSASGLADMRSDELELSTLLSDSQCEQIDQYGEDVKLATQALSAVIRKRLPSNESLTGSKMKRMLPATPGIASGRPPMMRPKSAKHPDTMRRSKSYYDVNGKRSNEI